MRSKSTSAWCVVSGVTGSDHTSLPNAMPRRFTTAAFGARIRLPSTWRKGRSPTSPSVPPVPPLDVPPIVEVPPFVPLPPLPLVVPPLPLVVPPSLCVPPFPDVVPPFPVAELPPFAELEPLEPPLLDALLPPDASPD